MTFKKLMAASLAAIITTTSLCATASAAEVQQQSVSYVTAAAPSKVTTKKVTMTIGTAKKVTAAKFDTKNAKITYSKKSVVKAVYTSSGKLKIAAVNPGTTTVSLYNGKKLVNKYKVTVRDSYVTAVASYEIPENVQLEVSTSLDFMDSYLDGVVTAKILNGKGMQVDISLVGYDFMSMVLDSSGVYLDISRAPDAAIGIVECFSSKTADSIGFSRDDLKEYIEALRAVLPAKGTALYLSYEDIRALGISDAAPIEYMDLYTEFVNKPEEAVNNLTALLKGALGLDVDSTVISDAKSAKVLNKKLISTLGSSIFTYDSGRYTMTLTDKQLAKVSELFTNASGFYVVPYQSDTNGEYRYAYEVSGQDAEFATHITSTGMDFYTVVRCSALDSSTKLDYPKIIEPFTEFMARLSQMNTAIY